MNQPSISKTVMISLACTFLALLSLACSPSDSNAPDNTDAPAATEASPSTSVDANDAEAQGEDSVTFEPAYPTDVSAEGLDADDAAQQQTHSHGGESHSHGDGEHSHGEGEHSHGEDGHSHGDGDEHAH